VKKNLAELLTEVRVARNKLRLWRSRISSKVEQYRSLSISNATRFSVLAEQYAKESEQLEKISEYLEKLDVLLELLEVKIETVITVGKVVNDAPAVVEALKLFKGITPSLSTEFSLAIDAIYTDFYTSIDVPQEVKIRSTNEAKKVLEEVDSIVKMREEGAKA
jgi:division protein CdvB (Snf7/Vps24/ESCRT-III family)